MPTVLPTVSFDNVSFSGNNAGDATGNVTPGSTITSGTVFDNDDLFGNRFSGSIFPNITLAVTPSSVLEDGAQNLVYTFTRTGATTNAVTVNYAIAGTATATDYTGATPGTGKTITFAAGSAFAALAISPTADRRLENNETTTLTLSPGGGYTVGTSDPVTGTITNDDVLLGNNPLAAPVYRFFNTIAGGHFFTTSEAERDFVLNNLSQYQFEGIGLRASTLGGDNLLPIHRFFNTVAGGHFFTASVAERDAVLANLPQYVYEGVGFYTYGGGTNFAADVYRFFNTVAGGHFFTTSAEERNAVIANLPQYIFEGVGFEAGFA
jgi:hypothetical protein